METEKFLDRNRLKKSLTLWRIVGVISITTLIVLIIGKFNKIIDEDYIAVLNVSNIIADNPDRSKALTKIAENQFAKALIVHINSPGGTVVGGETLHHHLKNVSNNKPVVAVIHDLGTSAAYMAAIASDQIFTRQSSIVGSIGVIVQTTDITAMLENFGIRPEAIKSSPLKAQPNPLEPMNKKVRETTKLLVADIFEMFIDMVVEGRQLDKQKVKLLADGRVFTGRQAVKNGLADAIGGENEAINWLSERKNINDKLPLKLIKVNEYDSFLKKILDNFLGKISISDRLGLDGLVSLWHPNVW